MKKNCLLTLSLLFAFTHSTQSYAQGLVDKTVERAAAETLLSMPEPPLGYAVSKHPLVADNKLLGFQVLVIKEGAVSKVVIKVETSRDLSGRGHRVAACKGYFNGFASELNKAGFKMTAHKVPDVEKSNFKTPVVFDLTFTNDEGANILVNKRMFFTTKGYDVSVIAGDENDLKLLTHWAAQIQPASR